MLNGASGAAAAGVDATMQGLIAAMAVVGVVVIVAALFSGLVDRTGFPQVAVFLALGAVLGPAGLGVLDISLGSPVLRVVATLSLVLVLFTDALTITLEDVRRHSELTLRVLGPGTLLTAALVALAAWGVLGLAPPAAAILGAALASTDPVLLRGLLRRRDLPGGARAALRLESGLNDAVLLPVVLLAMAFSRQDAPLTGAEWARLGLDLLLLGPGAGVVVGVLSVAALDLVRRKIGVRRDYESLYSLGVALSAYAAAEAVHGSGFVAAFVAGLTIAALDVELCDCFLEYGETTAEMALLFAFVLFGGSLIWSGVAIAGPAALAFAGLAILIRPAVFWLSLAGSSLDRRGRRVVAWFGPRGLSSLLLVLLPVFAGIPGSDRLFALCSLVVLFSVVIHGGTPLLLSWGQPRSGRRRSAGGSGGPVTAGTLAAGPGSGAGGAGDACVAAGVAEPAALAAGDADSGGVACRIDDGASVPAAATSNAVAPPNSAAGTAASPAAVDDDRRDDRHDDQSERISVDEVRALQNAGAPVVLLDVRTDRTYARGVPVAGAVRLPPDHLAERVAELGLPHHAWLVAFCA